MKPILSVIILSFMVSFFAQGQTKQPAKAAAKPAASGDCFKQWYSLFKERGANPIPDGVNDVVITLRSNDYTECFMGRIEVSNGRITGKLQVQKVDGSYAEFDKRVSASYQNTEGTLKEDLRDVINGMSASVALTDGEYIRLFFYKSLAEKPVANKKAPAPSVLVKN
ncbi:MAG TPA: hypothetical protein VK589_12585 [Chryseolinea sp.]|nr:hypothetical protein [Chryseolinea sp.]